MLIHIHTTDSHLLSLPLSSLRSMAWRLSKPKPPKPQDAAASHSAALLPESSLPEVRRDFYLEHPRVASLTAEEADAIRTAMDVRVHFEGSMASDPCPNPVDSFLEGSFPQYVLDALDAAGITEPTPIQRQSFPIAMRGLDLVGLAATGSGKTLAYLLPALVHVNAQPPSYDGDGPLALVLAPTRELAVQIHEECVRFGHPCGVRTACIYGGVPKGTQVLALSKAPEIVVATPGRLTDLLNARRTEMSRCTFLVIDEADRMLDLGFEPQASATTLP